jgi:acetylglutamate kinase
MSHLTVLKIGGELLEDAAAVERIARGIVALAARERLLVVHGGGRTIDAELRGRGLAPRFVDGLRVTDAAALDAVLSVLAGRTNPRLVAAIGAAGGRAVGLTGADAAVGLCERAPRFTAVSGESFELGLVGHPVRTDATLLQDLVALGYLPVVCSIGVDRDGALLNVNADTLAAHLAVALGARRLIVAGTTPGVLDPSGNRLCALGLGDIERMIASRTAHSGMVAKLAACRHAALGGVADISIVAGQGCEGLDSAEGTRIAMELNA